MDERFPKPASHRRTARSSHPPCRYSGVERRELPVETVKGAPPARSPISRSRSQQNHQRFLMPRPPRLSRRERPGSKKLGPYMAWIYAILEGDSQVHKKQRHTARRIFERLRDEQGFSSGYTIVREYVSKAMLRRREMFVPLSHRSGHAQADFGEADG